MDRYPPTAAHGLVGDLQTGAPVQADGAVDWFTAARPGLRGGDDGIHPLARLPPRGDLEKMLTYANHVGLLAEEIGPGGEQLGNFPQAFTHFSLITAARTPDEALDRQRD
ncbi:hypothetical protein SATRM34S_06151 [Streptomyces atroolivaceus]|nr:glycoside hydrolase family 15 protein [Streptomyces atroolivaceus]